MNISNSTSGHMSSNTEQIIRQIVAEELSWEQELPVDHFSEHLDSMQKLSLLVAIEDHFEISFDEDDDAEINTLQDLISRIHHKENLKQHID